MSPKEAAYGALWRIITDDPTLAEARAVLLKSIGPEGQRRAVTWACEVFDAVSDAEIRRIDV